MGINATKKLSPKLNKVIDAALADHKVENPELRKIRRALYADIDGAKDRVALTKVGRDLFTQLAPHAADKKAQTYIKITERVLGERVLVEQAARDIPKYMRDHRDELSPLLKRVIVEEKSVRPGAAKSTPLMYLGSYSNGGPWLGVQVKKKAGDDAMIFFEVQDAVKALIKKTPALKKLESIEIICQYNWD